MSTSNHVLSCLLYKHTNNDVFDDSPKILRLIVNSTARCEVVLLPFASVSKRGFVLRQCSAKLCTSKPGACSQASPSYENEFRLLVHFHANQIRFCTRTRSVVQWSYRGRTCVIS